MAIQDFGFDNEGINFMDDEMIIFTLISCSGLFFFGFVSYLSLDNKNHR